MPTPTLKVDIFADAGKATKAVDDFATDLVGLGDTTSKVSKEMAGAFDGLDTGGARKQVRDLGDEAVDAGRKGADGLDGMLDGLKGFTAGAGAVFAGGALLEGASALGEKVSGAFTDALDAEAVGDKLTAQLGLNAEQSAQYGAIAGNLYADAYGESLGEVNDALADVTRNIGGLSDDLLGEATAHALDFAAAFDEDVGGATVAVGQMMKTGLVRDATEAFDVLTVGFQNGVNKADDLLEVFEEYSTKFRDLGLDSKGALGLMQQGLKAGARDADTVADALKEFAIRSTDASETSADAFTALGLDAGKMTKQFAQGGQGAAEGLDLVLDRLRGMDDPVARNAAAVGLFGTKAEDLGAALFALDPSEAVAALGDVSGAADRMGTDLADNAATRIESFQRKMSQGLVNFVGDVIVPGVSTAIDKLSPVFDRVGETVRTGVDTARGYWDTFVGGFTGEGAPKVGGEWGQRIFEFGDTIRKLADEWLPRLADAFKGLQDKLAPFWETIKGNENILITLGIVIGVGLAAAVWSLASAFGGLIVAAAPIVAVGAAIFGLVAGIRWLWENNETFRAGVTAVWEWLKTNVPPIIETIKAGVQTAFGWIVDTAVPAVKGAFDSFLGFLNNTFLPAAKTVFDAISQAVSTVVAVVRPIIDFLVGVLQDNIGHLVEIVANQFDLIRNIIANVWQVISNIFQFFLNVISGNWGAAWENVKNIVSAVWDTITNVISNAFGVLREIIQFIGAFIGSVAGRLFEPIWSAVVGGFNNLVSFIGGLPSRIASAASGMFDGISGAFKAAINFIIDGWNRLAFVIPGFDLGPVHFDGFRLDIPDLPRLATGGIVTRPTLALIGEAGPEAVIPLGATTGAGRNVVHLTVNVSHTGLGVDSPRLQRDIVTALDRWTERNGPLRLAGGA